MKKDPTPLASPASPPAWTRKDLIGIRDLSRDEITLVLDTAEHAAQPLTVIVNWPALLNKVANSQ